MPYMLSGQVAWTKIINFIYNLDLYCSISNVVLIFEMESHFVIKNGTRQI